MCVAFWTLDDPDYALILCANRDEFLARPAHPAAPHSSFSDSTDDAERITVISGRDVLGGGTWLGLAPSSGRVSLLTNITEPPPSPAPPASRGLLAPMFLQAQPRTPIAQLFPPDAKYAGFNLLALEAEWDGGDVHFPHAVLVSNGGAGGRVVSRELRTDERLLGGLSNGIHITPEGASDGAGEAWLKVRSGRPRFAAAVVAHRQEISNDVGESEGDAEQDLRLASRLFGVLRTPPAEPPRGREELRNAICVSPLKLPISNPPTYYGTRTATVLMVRRDGRVLFVERDVYRLTGGEGGVELNEGDGVGERLFRVQLGAPE